MVVNNPNPISKFLPTFNDRLAILKSSVSDPDTFEDYINLCNLRLVGEEDQYYIIEGSNIDIEDFKYFWNN